MPEKRNPAERFKALRITKKDRAEVDPFPIAEAEVLIAAMHRDWGEQIALEVGDCNLDTGKVKINKARVMGRDKDTGLRLARIAR